MCYNREEVNAMEQDRLQPKEQEEPKKPYVPRPWWQVWGARLLLVLFIVGLLIYYFAIARRYA